MSHRTGEGLQAEEAAGAGGLVAIGEVRWAALGDTRLCVALRRGPAHGGAADAVFGVSIAGLSP